MPASRDPVAVVSRVAAQYDLGDPPQAVVDGSVKQDYTAREVEGAERGAWWERAVAAWPDYAEYQKKTARVIPVFVLTPEGA